MTRAVTDASAAETTTDEGPSDGEISDTLTESASARRTRRAFIRLRSNDGCGMMSDEREKGFGYWVPGAGEDKTRTRHLTPGTLLHSAFIIFKCRQASRGASCIRREIGLRRPAALPI